MIPDGFKHYSYNKLLAHMRKFLHFHVFMGIIDNLIAKYFASVVGFWAVSLPFMAKGTGLGGFGHGERSSGEISRWLDAHCDRNCELKTLPRNVILTDATGDGDYRLVLVDLKLGQDVRSRLKVFKGPVICSDQSLPAIPSGLIGFYTDQFEPRIPAIGVSCGSDMLLYKNNKPYFKFSVPELPITPLEGAIWKKLANDEINDVKAQVIDELKSIEFKELSARSQKLLSMPENGWKEYIHTYINSEPKKNIPITCTTTIHKNYIEVDSIACPVLGVECGLIYILDPQTFSILYQGSVCSTKATPIILECTGSFDTDYRLIIACREGQVCLLRRAWLEGKVLFQSNSDIIDMILVPGDNFIVIATTDRNLTCYTKRGSKLWSSPMKSSIICLCLIPLKHFSTSLVCVGLYGGLIQMYQGRHVVDQLMAPDTPSSIVFGHMGQEDHVLVTTTIKGAIDFKILKRTADFHLSEHQNVVSPSIQSKPLPLPKRSKLFLEQTQRERQNAVDMHEHFQQDLIRVRLNAARAYVSQNDQSAIGNDKEMIKIAAQVLGLGPKFTLIITVENMSNDQSISGLMVVFHTNPRIYGLSSRLVNIPLIPPNLSYKLMTKVDEKGDVNENSQQMNIPNKNNLIRVFVVKNQQSQPVLAATINMPPTDTSALLI